MEKRSRIILAQADHLSGEVLGFAIGKLMECGARNVQVLPSITKKNRPGSVLIIDADEEREAPIARFLVQEMKIAGYHRVDATHVFHRVSFLPKSLRLTRNGSTVDISFLVKAIGDPPGPLSLDIEHDTLVDMQRTIEEQLGTHMALNELRAVVEAHLRDADMTIVDAEQS
jgi:hypothetical protein